MSICKPFAVFAVLTATTLVQAGCAAETKSAPEQPLEAATRTTLEAAAQQIQGDLMNLNTGTSSAHLQPPAVATPPVMGPLAQPVTIRWAGPPLPAIQAVARMIGYSVEVRGRAGRQLPVITLEATEKQALSVLEDIGWQCGPALGLVVKEDQHTLYVFFGD